MSHQTDGRTERQTDRETVVIALAISLHAGEDTNEQKAHLKRIETTRR